eukprot:scaffold350_cov333-Pavlova_lutheri.AAC.14
MGGESRTPNPTDGTVCRFHPRLNPTRNLEVNLGVNLGAREGVSLRGLRKPPDTSQAFGHGACFGATGSAHVGREMGPYHRSAAQTKRLRRPGGRHGGAAAVSCVATRWKERRKRWDEEAEGRKIACGWVPGCVGNQGD